MLAETYPNKVVGITGGIGSGKSTVARMFADLGAILIDADESSHRCYAAGGELHRRIVERYGPAILDRSGEIARPRLAEILFSSPEEKKWLEAEIHPATVNLIEKEIEIKLAEAPPLIVVETALLFETGYAGRFATHLLVDISEPEQRRRLIQRDGLGPEALERRLSAQWPLAKKRLLAGHILDNSGTLEATRAQVEGYFARWSAPS